MEEQETADDVQQVVEDRQGVQCMCERVAEAHLAVRCRCRNSVPGSQSRTAALHGGSPHDERTGLPYRNISKPCGSIIGDLYIDLC